MKKMLLILLVIGIFIGVIWIAGYVKPTPQAMPAAPKVGTSPQEEEEPGKTIRDLTLTYFSDDQRYRLETTLQTVEEDREGNVSFAGMKAVLRAEDEAVQMFTTPAGTIRMDAGVVQLQGPVAFAAGDYRLSVQQVEMDLNQGVFQAKGAVSVAGKNYALEAGEMSADFDFRTIHFTGRPKLTVTKGG